MKVSKFVMRQLEAALSEQELRELVHLGEKPAKDRPRVTVLVASTLNACDYYRAFIPLRELDRRNLIQSKLTSSFTAMDAYTSDLLVCYRPKDQGILRYVNNPASVLAHLLADYDDDVLSVPSANFLEPNFGEPDKEASVNIASRVDQLTVSTRRLAALFAANQPRCSILPNVVDAAAHERLLAYYPRKPKDVYRIAWAGTFTHTEDLMGGWSIHGSPPFLTAIREFLYKYNKTEMVFFGMCPQELRNEFPGRVHYRRAAHLFEYMSVLASMQLDLLLYPLIDFQFNYSKSNIRWLEASMINVPVIASPIHSYKDVGQELLQTVPFDAEAWFSAIEYAYHHPDEMQARAEKSRAWVMEHWTIQATWPAWYQVWSAAAEGKWVVQDFTPPTYSSSEVAETNTQVGGAEEDVGDAHTAVRSGLDDLAQPVVRTPTETH